MGVTKVPFINFSVNKIFEPAKVPVRYFASNAYLTGVPAAELQLHLQIWTWYLTASMYFGRCWKSGKERNGENWLSAPHPSSPYPSWLCDDCMIQLGQHWFRQWFAAWRHQLNHYLNQSGLNISEFLGNSPEGIPQEMLICPWCEFEIYYQLKITVAFPNGRWVNNSNVIYIYILNI